MKLPIAAAVLALATLNIAAHAQTICLPVRYQYGQYNEVFYGGVNPIFTSNNFGYLPDYLQANYTARRRNASTLPYPTPFMMFGPGTRFYSTHFLPSISIEYPSNTTLVFTDHFPYEEVGHMGYTIDDARNEAYSNVPRIQYGPRRAAPASPPAPAPAAEVAPAPKPAAPPIDPRYKAIPLLDWARNEHSRNPALYKAIIKEAKKWDPDATAALEKELGT